MIWIKGQLFSKAHIEKIRQDRIGRTQSPETRNKIRDAHKGKPKGESARLKMSIAKKGMYLGENNPNWKGGITPINQAIKTSKEYKLWRKSVFERDNYTCLWCGKRGVLLNADHIKPFARYPELRFAIDNGRTLCVPCHETTDTYKGKAKNYDYLGSKQIQS